VAQAQYIKPPLPTPCFLSQYFDIEICLCLGGSTMKSFDPQARSEAEMIRMGNPSAKFIVNPGTGAEQGTIRLNT
jgi:hypothetical protein